MLVTGGAGFIGLNRGEALAEENDVHWALTEAYPMALIADKVAIYYKKIPSGCIQLKDHHALSDIEKNDWRLERQKIIM